MNNLVETLRALGPARLAAMALVSVLVLGFFGLLITNATTPEKAVLFTDVAVEEVAAMAAQLDAANIPYVTSDNGTEIRVPSDQLGRARLVLAQEGVLPRTGQLGYEDLIDNQSLATPNAVQELNRQRALEGELARNLTELDPVRSARVLLVLPRREIFAREANPASASVTLTLRPGRPLTAQHVLAVQNLVAAAVPNLDPARVTVVDQTGRLLSRPADDGTAIGFTNRLEEFRRALEADFGTRIEAMLAPAVGAANVRAQVSIDIERERLEETVDRVNPDEVVTRSTQTQEESEESNETRPPEAVSVGANTPDAAAPPAPQQGAESRSTRNSTQETVNNEFSRSQLSRLREPGGIERLTAAVSVSGTWTRADDGTWTYQPVPPDTLAKLEDLAKSAIGFDPDRRDEITVRDLQPPRPDDAGLVDLDSGLFGFDQNELVRVAETVILAVVGLLVVLLVVRPLMMRALADARQVGERRRQEEERLLAEQSGALALPGPGSATQNALAEREEEESAAAERMIDINQVEGRVRASSMRKIGELVESHPAEAASVVRSWMYQET